MHYLLTLLQNLLHWLRPPAPPACISDCSDIGEDSSVKITPIPHIKQPAPLETPAPETLPAPHTPRHLWCLDAGHGAKTKGKRSPKMKDGSILLEYQWNRDIVNLIAAQLRTLGVPYFITVPETDVDNFLEQRVHRANTCTEHPHLPRIFVSIHSNAAPAPPGQWCAPDIHGIETWHHHHSPKSKAIATIFQQQLIAHTGWKNRFIKSRPDNQFYVLKHTHMPAILTENGFYNNEQQCYQLMQQETKETIAAAHVAAIMEIEKRTTTTQNTTP